MARVPSDPAVFARSRRAAAVHLLDYVFLNRLDASSAELAFAARSCFLLPEARLFSYKPSRRFLGRVIDNLFRLDESDSGQKPESLGTLISV
jgi:hypothetical protein